MLRLFNGNGTNQYRLSFLVAFLDFLYYGIPFVRFVQVYLVVFILAGYRLVCRNCNYIELVNLVELNCFCCGRTSHAGKLCVHAEKVLECDCCKSPVPLCYLEVFLCFDCLMQTVTVAASFKNASRKFVYNLNLTVLYDIVNVIVVQNVCTNCLCKVVYEFKVFFIKNRRVSRNQVVLVQDVIDFVHTAVGKRNPLALFVNLVFTGLGLTLFRSHVHFVGIVVCLWIFFHLGELVNVFVYLMVFVCVVLSLS